MWDSKSEISDSASAVLSQRHLSRARRSSRGRRLGCPGITPGACGFGTVLLRCGRFELALALSCFVLDLHRLEPRHAEVPAHVAGHAFREHAGAAELPLELARSAGAQVRVLLVTVLDLARLSHAEPLGHPLVGLRFVRHWGPSNLSGS